MAIAKAVHQTATNGLNIDIQATQGNFVLEAKFDLPAKGVSIIFGASGSGKTTLLRAIAGLDASTGTIQFNGDHWLHNTVSKPTAQRPLAYVFQEASLFPHMTVAQNLAFAEKYAIKKELSSRDQLIQLFDIEHTLTRMPNKLSGGERQRVAIVRALLRQPKLLLMDEPLASLDDARKRDILPYLERLKNDFNLPIIYVTHSLQEAARLGDTIVALDQGKVIAQGNMTDILSDPLFPEDIGREAGSIVEGGISSIDSQWQLANVHLSAGNKLKIPAQNLRAGQIVRLWIQARDISLSHTETPDSSIINSLPCVIKDIRNDRNPALLIVQLQSGDNTLTTRITRISASQLGLKIDQPIYAHIKAAALL
jgi:molybdate transport system ATP-binding protein